jgi:hypothetical protein
MHSPPPLDAARVLYGGDQIDTFNTIIAMWFKAAVTSVTGAESCAAFQTVKTLKRHPHPAGSVAENLG